MTFQKLLPYMLSIFIHAFLLGGAFFSPSKVSFSIKHAVNSPEIISIKNKPQKKNFITKNLFKSKKTENKIITTQNLHIKESEIFETIVIKTSKSEKRTSQIDDNKKSSIALKESYGGKTFKNSSIIFNPAPIYPFLAQKRGIEGVVLLKVNVSSEGIPKNSSIAKSSGYDSLDNSALNTIKKWRFEPSKVLKYTTSQYINIAIDFKLTD